MGIRREAFTCVAVCFAPCLIWAQESTTAEVLKGVEVAPGQVVTQPVPANATPVGAVPPGTVQAQPGQPKKPGISPQTPPAEKNSAKSRAPKVITPPDKPPFTPDPKEFDVVPKNGKLSVSFNGQSWPDVLTWLKEISGRSLDWQELPAGYLNFKTNKEYTVDQIQDLINRHLLARGYTILVNDGMMTVENIAKLNLALVPRVKPEELKDMPDNQFVKVSMQLSWMLATDAVVEFKPMLTNNGKMFALKKTNRLEAVDSAKALRDIWEMISAEQSADGQKLLVQKFDLTHVRAEDMVASLKELLGVDATKRSTGQPGQDPRQAARMAEMMAAQAAAMAQGGGGGKKPKPTNEIYIIASKLGNSVIVNAPPDKMKTVEQAIKALDQPTDQTARLHSALDRTEVYRLANLDPDAFVKTLREIGGLSPQAKVHVDKLRKAIVLSGDKTDHMIVELLSSKLDKASRRFYVIPLRRLSADYVAGSIRFMMGKEKKDSQNQSSRRSFFFGFPGMSRQDEGNARDEFRVEGDVEYRRLLLWCNDLEYEQITNLLKELGEVQAPGSPASRRRIFDTNSREEALRLIERIQNKWYGAGGNPLQLDVPRATPRTRPSQQDYSPDQLDPIDRQPSQKTQPAKSSDDSAALNFPRIPSRPRVRNPRSKSFEGPASPLKLVRLIHQTPFQQRIAQEDPRKNPPVVDAQANTDSEQKASLVPDSAAEPASVLPPQKATLSDGVDPSQRRLREFIDRMKSQVGSPIQVRIGGDGRIYLESDDSRGLDRFELMLEENAPPQQDWKVFELQNPNSYAYGIETILKDLFEEEMKVPSKDSLNWDPFWGITPGKTENPGPRRLSNRKPMKIIADEDSHTILVQGANREQLHTIGELIKVYDKPTQQDTTNVRRTKVIAVKYSDAQVIADAIKDVYRDLLSANDKALQQNNKNKEEKDTRRDDGLSVLFGPPRGDGEKSEKGRERVRFKGQLSIGVDEVSNILIVSAAGGLLDNISQIVEALDTAARPNSTVRVHRLDPRVNPAYLQERLSKLFGKKVKTSANKKQTGGENATSSQNANAKQPGQPVGM